jgi:formiminotetrahydrofolate cyclodeaminase
MSAVTTAGTPGLRLRELLAAVGGDELPGAGSVAAVVAALAAALVAHAARSCVSRSTGTEWPEAGAAAAQAEALRDRLEPLVHVDAEVYGAAVVALDGGSSDAGVGAALARAAETPLLIAEAAADVALLAVETACRCDPRRRTDVEAAGRLAAAAAHAAAELVAANLTALEGDPRVRRARAAAADAARALAT